MLLARFLSKLFNKEGIVLVDSRHQKYICGELTNKEKPLTLKLLKSDLNWKLLVYPELYLGEEYYKGNIEIENGTIHDFLNLALKNLDRGKVNIYSTIFNNFRYALQFLAQHNFIKASKPPFLSTDLIPEFDTVILKLLFSISLLNFTFLRFGKNLLLVLLLAWLTL